MFTRWILLFTLAISSWLLARASFVQTANNNFVEVFTKTCPSDGIPVCAARGKDYFLLPSERCLNNVNMEDVSGLFRNIKKVPTKYCINSCYLTCPQVDDPVCALNVRTQQKGAFRNMCELTKHACRTNMDYQQLPTHDCTPLQERLHTIEWHQKTEIFPHTMKSREKRSKKYKSIPVPCTEVVRPVCGVFKGVKSTFKNECEMNAENVKYGKGWRVIKQGICAEDNLNVKRNQNNKPQQRHSIIKRHPNFNENANFITYHNRQSDNIPHFKPDISLSSADFQKYMTSMYQTPNDQREFSNSVLNDQVANNIIQKIISLPTSAMDMSTSQEKIMAMEMQRQQPFVSQYVKSLPYRKNTFYRNFNRFDSKANQILSAAPASVARNDFHPEVSVTLERNIMRPQVLVRNEFIPKVTQTYEENEDHPPASHGLDNNSYPVNNLKKYNYYYQAFEDLPHETTTAAPLTTKQLDAVFVISRKTTPKHFIETTTKQSILCKYGDTPICGILSNGTFRTFETICGMMDMNRYHKDSWVKLHYGACETCQNECIKEYKPICVQRNGVNYTMVNKCYYNMGICLDKKSSWKKIADGECRRTSRKPTKRERNQHGIQYASKPHSPITLAEAVTTSNVASIWTAPTVTTKSNVTTNNWMLNATAESETTLASTKAAPTQVKSKKRNKTSKRKVARRSRPAVMTSPMEFLETFVMNLTKLKERHVPST